MWFKEAKDDIEGQNQELDPLLLEYLEDFKKSIKKEIEGSVRAEVERALSEETKDDNDKSPRRRHSVSIIPLTGMETNQIDNDQLDQDFFSMMMLSPLLSMEWLFGMISFSIQITLGVVIILEQVKTDFFGTTLSIPIKCNSIIQIAQVLAIILSIMTQEDLLMGVRIILMLPYHNKERWGNLIGVERNQLTMHSWIARIFLPNFLKAIQGSFILVASFVVIIQSDSTVNVLKDYSALFVVSSVDNLFFSLANMGYLGEKLSRKAQDVKKVEVDGADSTIKKTLTSVLLCLMISFLGAWAYVTIGQEAGRYVLQAYPLCPVTDMFDSVKGIDFLSIIGDKVCQYPKGVGTNVVECGWDGGDCVKLDQRYPECHANDFSLLGNGVCNNDRIINSKACGFDNGDCIDSNVEKQDKYPACLVENIGWIGDGTCNGGVYFTSGCDFDGQDCIECSVDDMALIGDGNCDGGRYNTAECSFDGADCDEENALKQDKYSNCTVENIGWIGDGVCNGGAYASSECGNDGGDCKGCSVTNINLIGNGFCDGGDFMRIDACSLDGGDCKGCFVENIEWLNDFVCNGGSYNTEECGFDGGDCLDLNNQLKEKYNNCVVQNPWWVGDGFCHGGAYNTEDCSYDGGDCDSCSVLIKSNIGDGICDDSSYNSKSCGFDGLDCEEFNIQQQHNYPNCSVTNIGWISDGTCNGGEYTAQECENDGGDCNMCVVDDISKVGDGFCDDGQYNSEDCSFDGNDCAPFMKVIGDNYDGIFKWSGLYAGSDGSLYGIPAYAIQTLRIDPITKFTELVGDVLGDGALKWLGGVVGADGIVYGVPHNAKSIFSYNPLTKETKLLGVGHPLLDSDKMYSGAVLAENGHIYFFPFTKNKVLKFDPSNMKDPLVEIGDNLDSGGMAGIGGGALGSDGNAYGVPVLGQANRILKIDVFEDTAYYMGDKFDGPWNWNTAILAKDGNIYACPYNANQVLQINIKDQTTHFVGPELGNVEWKFGEFVEGADGFLYGLPLASDHLLRFDPILHVGTLIPLDPKLHGFRKWAYGSYFEGNNFIYGVPAFSENVLEIKPLQYRT